jgi:putative sigma-54 modulation protein
MALQMAQIDVHGTTSPALDEQVQSKIGGALEPLGKLVQTVDVRLEDVNGASKAPGMRCHITVSLKGEDPLVIDEIDKDMYEAIAKAAARVKNVVSRKHEKRMEKLHGRL